MVYSPIITETAEQTYIELLSFLIDNYGVDTPKTFAEKSATIVDHISKHPLMFPVSKDYYKHHRAIIDRYTSIYYTIKEIQKHVVIHCFWHNSRNPKYLKVFLTH